MSDPIAKWEKRAREVDASKVERLPVPMPVLLQEAVVTQSFVERYWETQRKPHAKEVLRPGLEQAGEKLSKTIGPEILELRAAVDEANARVITTSPKLTNSESLRERGEFIVNELASALEWLFDDGVEDEKDAQLATVRSAHKNDKNTAVELAHELDDYLVLATEHQKELAKIEAFDDSLVSEGRDVADRLRQGVQDAVAVEANRAAYDLRNRLAFLLYEKILTVRAAARFVFRNHPEIVREVTSAYRRRQRAESRRKKKTEPKKDG